MKFYVTLLCFMMLQALILIYSSVDAVGCNECNGLQVKCISKNAVLSCLQGPPFPKIIRCPTGTFCDVNKLPWCHKDHKAICPL